MNKKEKKLEEITKNLSENRFKIHVIGGISNLIHLSFTDITPNDFEEGILYRIKRTLASYDIKEFNSKYSRTTKHLDLNFFLIYPNSKK